MSGLTLYEVTKEAMELNEILSETEGELTPDLEQRLDTFLKAGKDKIHAACCVIRELDAAEEACKDEAKRIMDRSKMYAANSSQLRRRVLIALDAGFGGKLKTPLFTVYGQNSAPTVGFEIAADADLNAIQQTYPDVVRTKHELNKIALKARVEQGLEIPNAIQVIDNPGTRYLRIK